MTDSDLRIDCGPRDTLVGFRGGDDYRRSDLLDEEGQPLSNSGSLQVLGPNLQSPGEPLRWGLRDLVGNSGTKFESDPTSLLLDRLVRIQAGDNLGGVLRLGKAATFLVPLRFHALDLLGRPEVYEGLGVPPHRNAVSVGAQLDGQQITVELWIPVQHRRFVRVSRVYDSEPLDYYDDTPQFMVWPDFICPDWTDYFLYQSYTEGKLRFDPIQLGERSVVKHERRRDGLPVAVWARSESPVDVLAARDPSSLDGSPERGLVLGPFADAIDRPRKEWRVSIDLGSTHTRVFYRDNGAKKPLEIQPRARSVTILTDQGTSQQEFFADLEDHSKVMDEIPTQLVMANDARPNVAGAPPPWLPYDGVAVLGRLGQDFFYNGATTGFFTEIKWSLSDAENDRARVFLSHLLLLARAEAFHKGARVHSVGHAYPSAFPPALEKRFRRRWTKLLEAEGIQDDGSEVEAWTVANYLFDRRSATPQAQLLAIDVGGSTSDISVWRDGTVVSLDSVRFAASAISAFWCLQENWSAYCKILETLDCSINTIRAGEGIAEIEARDRLPYFYVSLEMLKKADKLEDFVERLGDPEHDHRFLAHASFIYSALIYYLGVLARQIVDVETEEPEDFEIFFCGKGSAFLEWLREDGEWQTLEEVFKASVERGAKGKVGSVRIDLNSEPKWEVGYGRLVNAETDQVREVKARRNRREPWPVRVAEAGYGELDPLSELRLGELEELIEKGDSAVPRVFPELETFLAAWASSYYRHSATTELPGAFRKKLLQRLLGRAEGSWGYDVRHPTRRTELTLDPIFLLECKVFCEMTSQLPVSIWQGVVRE